jgi:hypothetical protein
MHRFSRKLVLAVVVIGALVAGGAAYTNAIDGNGTTSNTAGFADVQVQGASLTDAVYGFTTDGSGVNSVTLTFNNALAGDKLQLGLGGTGVTIAPCTSTAAVDTDANGVIQSAAETSGAAPTTVECDFSSPVTTSTATDLKVLVSNT